MEINWEAIGGVVSLIAVGVAGHFNGKRKRNAADNVVEANSRTEVAIADAEGALYARLKADVVTLSNDVRQMREEIANERKRSRRLEDHIRRLEAAMRRAGIEPPPFDFEVTS